MKPKAFLLHTVFFLSFTALFAPASETVVITDPVDAGSAGTTCLDSLDGYFLAPRPELLDCRNEWCYIKCANDGSNCPNPCEDSNCGRLNSYLRAAVKTGDAKEMLVRAAVAFYRFRHPDLSPGLPPFALPPFAPPFMLNFYGQAFADLPVTGRAAYASFRTLAPSEATLTADVEARLLAAFPTHPQVSSDVSWAIRYALDRAYQVAWALRGPTPHRNAAREGLGWIAVSGEDDSPHRPVNIRPTRYPQYNMPVEVNGIPVTTRYVVFSNSITDNYPVPGVLNTIPPDRDLPLIVGDVVLFIAGHSSSAEEAGSIAAPLLAQAPPGRPVTIISMDLPSNGYASMIEHEDIAPSIASKWNTGYPILDFIESFIVAFVAGLEARQPGIKSQIVGVIG